MTRYLALVLFVLSACARVVDPEAHARACDTDAGIDASIDVPCVCDAGFSCADTGFCVCRTGGCGYYAR
jgi:hypothetical protein